MTMVKTKTLRGFVFIDVLIVVSSALLIAMIIWVNQATISIKTEAQLSLGELRQIQSALEAYRKDAGKYPLSTTCPNTFGGGGLWQGNRSEYGGDCDHPCWIPEISELGYCPLPIERTRDTPGIREYLYRSDGTNYKLIYHSAPSMAVGDEYLDPARPTHAYGFWTAGAKEW